VVETPINLTERQKELLREFDTCCGQEGKHNPRAKGFMDKVKEFFGQ
jgi:molecular chaperone DnaJ